jgi:hypothetical protein
MSGDHATAVHRRFPPDADVGSCHARPLRMAAGAVGRGRRRALRTPHPAPIRGALRGLPRGGVAGTRIWISPSAAEGFRRRLRGRSSSQEIRRQADSFGPSRTTTPTCECPHPASCRTTRSRRSRHGFEEGRRFPAPARSLRKPRGRRKSSKGTTGPTCPAARRLLPTDSSIASSTRSWRGADFAEAPRRIDAFGCDA